MTLPFARMPTSWILHEQRLTTLSWTRAGSSATAALTLYIALLIAHNRKRLDSPADKSDEVRMTYGAIEERTGVSRAKIAPALHILESELELVQIERSHAGNAFTIVDIHATPFAQLPQTVLYDPKRRALRCLSNFTLRSKFELGALKLYLAILALRNTRTGTASVGYEKLVEYTGVRRSDISRCIGHLINLELIAVSSAVDGFHSSSGGHPHNVYRPLGLSTRSPDQNPAAGADD